MPIHSIVHSLSLTFAAMMSFIGVISGWFAFASVEAGNTTFAAAAIIVAIGGVLTGVGTLVVADRKDQRANERLMQELSESKRVEAAAKTELAAAHRDNARYRERLISLEKKVPENERRLDELTPAIDALIAANEARKGSSDSLPVVLPKLLIVEDEFTLARLWARYLGIQGYSIFVADTSKSAIAQLEFNCPDVVLLDLALNSADDGLSVLRYVCEHKIRTCIIVTTGTADPERLDACKGLGVQSTHIFTKPIVLEDLISAVQECLANRGS
jgi:CheY-like chemotaxis protein